MKTIFIASSSESLQQAEQIAMALRDVPGVTVTLWNQIFSPGIITFEAIEREARKFAGAVVLASPDDSSTIRDTSVRVPRANVMIELGYMTAVLGREAIALCKYDEATLATDLAGFTYVGMGPYPGDGSNAPIRAAVVEVLKRWANLLANSVDGAFRADVVHGYSGRWRFSGVFENWFDINIQPPDRVEADGFLDLYIPRIGRGGFGCAHLDLYIYVRNFYAHFRATDRITDVRCVTTGALSFFSEIYSRRRFEFTGEPPQREGFEDLVPGTNTFQWLLEPSPTERSTLIGAYDNRFGGVVRAHARVTAEKLGAGDFV